MTRCDPARDTSAPSDRGRLRITYLRDLFISSVMCICTTCATTAQTPNAPPINPDATPAARALLHDLDVITGYATISGQHNFPNSVSRYSDRVYDLTGEYSGIFGQDFGFSGGDDKDSTLGRPSMIEEAIRQYHNGAVIALTWHSVGRPKTNPSHFATVCKDTSQIGVEPTPYARNGTQ